MNPSKVLLIDVMVSNSRAIARNNNQLERTNNVQQTIFYENRTNCNAAFSIKLFEMTGNHFDMTMVFPQFRRGIFPLRMFCKVEENSFWKICFGPSMNHTVHNRSFLPWRLISQQFLFLVTDSRWVCNSFDASVLWATVKKNRFIKQHPKIGTNSTHRAKCRQKRKATHQNAILFDDYSSSIIENAFRKAKQSHRPIEQNMRTFVFKKIIWNFYDDY